MGWDSTKDTLNEVKIEFDTKDQAVKYAEKNNLKYDLIEPNKRKFVIKSYADNFTN